MDSLADLWVRSGRNPQRLYQGSTEDIVKELKAWVERRKASNNVNMDVLWNMFQVTDSARQLSKQPVEVQEGQHSMAQALAITATQMANFERTRNLEKEKARENLLANFFLMSLKHRGIDWPLMPFFERTQVDAYVCAFLGTRDRGFNARMELDTLEDKTRITQWQTELRRRDAINAQEIANDPIPGVNTHPIGLIGARMRQEIVNNPTISTIQAAANAAHGIMIPDAVDFLKASISKNAAATPSTTSAATSATGANAPTTDDTAVYIADMLGNVNIATGPSSSAAVNTPLRMDTAASSSLNNAADTPGNANRATNPSSSTATDGSATDQTLLGTQDQHGASKMSKAKKKRERAKRAAENAGNDAGNDEDDNDGEVANLADG